MATTGNVVVVHDPDIVTTQGHWMVGISDGNKSIQVSGDTIPGVIISLTDLNTGTKKLARFREFQFYDANNSCVAMKCWILSTAPEPA
jgi:hypothetical protein